MFSFGWSEISIVLVIVVIIIGPKEIPNLIKQLGSFSKSLKKASRQFKNSINDLVEENDVGKIKNSINNIKDFKKSLDPSNDIKKQIDDIKETVNFTDKELKNINKKILKED